MNKVIEIIKHLIQDKFSGAIVIRFNQGGIRGIKKITEENIS
jgi:hypothetical protein